jgi:hypothetical protein
MKGVSLIKYTDNDFEVEFVKDDGTNYQKLLNATDE